MQIWNNVTFKLSLIIAVLSAIASAGGLLLKNSYRDSEFFKTAWLANDIITLCIVVPFLIYFVIYAKKGNRKAHLVLMGLLAYFLYNYAFYLFGAKFNIYFLLYVAILTTSIYALISAFYNLNWKELNMQINYGKHIRWVSIYLLFTTIPLLIVEGSQCLQFVFTGKEPTIPPLIFALDLSIVIPNSILAAILLWKRKILGYVLSLIMLVKGFVYGLVLCTSTAVLANSEVYGKWDPLMPFYLIVAIGGLTGSIYLLWNFKDKQINSLPY